MSFFKVLGVVAGTAAVGSGGYYLYKKTTAPIPERFSPYGGMDPQNFVPMKVKDIIPYNDNTKVYKFELDNPRASPNLPLTSYVVARATVGDKPVARPYTPIDADERGVLNLLVKSYPNGNLSKKFAELKVGDTMEIKGPSPKYKYEPNTIREAYLIAGGTGITPMLQMAEGILDNPADKTNVQLVFGNVEEKDILLREKLDGLAKKYPNRFNVKYILDKPPANWKGLAGYMDEKVLGNILPKPSPDVKVFVCGPPGMMKAISGPKAPDYSQGEVDGVLKNLGYTKDNVYKF